METFYNTSDEEGYTLENSIANASRQEDLILEYFKDNPIDHYAPHEIMDILLPNVPITSVRRAMTNLTEGGKLIKTDLKVMGEHGKFVSTWRFNNRINEPASAFFRI